MVDGLSTKLDRDFMVDSGNRCSDDLTSQARAFQSVVSGGMYVAKASSSGLMADDSEF